MPELLAARGASRRQRRMSSTLVAIALSAWLIAVAAGPAAATADPARWSVPAQGQLEGVAGAADLSCVTEPAQARTTLVTARPRDVASRSAIMRTRLIRAISVSSAMLDQRARELAPGRGARVPVLCTGGVPVVHDVVLPSASRELTSPSVIIGEIAAQLDAQGVQHRHAMMLAFLDADPFSRSFAEGGAAVVLRASWARAAWRVTLHEWLHAMTALAPRSYGLSPNGTPAGHCTDGLDVMCYHDGSTAAPQRQVCATMVIDCRGDDYFHPSPPAGSWLARHPDANLAIGFPDWIDYSGRATLATPTSVTVIASSSQAVLVRWKSAPGASRGHRIWMRDARNGGVIPQLVAPVGATAIRVGGLASPVGSGSFVMRGLRIQALGEGASASTTIAVPAVRIPAVPRVARLRVVARTSRTITVAWVPLRARDLSRVEIQHQRGYIDTNRTAGSALPASGRFTVRGLRRGTSYLIKVVTFDRAGNFTYPAAQIRASTLS